MSRHRLSIASFGIAMLFCFAAVRPAAALSSGGIGGYPANPDPGIQYSDSWFIYSLDVNESKEDRLLLTNTSDETQSVHLYPVDSAPTGDGNFSLEKEDDPRDGIGAWITLSESYVTLEPGQQKEVSFTIRIPESASVGEHSGGIILQKAEPMNDVAVGQNSASIVTRIGIRVYQTVPGELVKQVELSRFEVKGMQGANGKPIYHIDLAAVSKSNVSLEADAILSITGWGKTKYFPNSRFKDGLYLDFSDFGNFFKGETMETQWQILKGQTVSTNWEWPKPRFGVYTFQASVRYEGTNGVETIKSAPVTITVIPWIEIMIILVLLGCWIGWYVFKRMRFSARKWQPYDIRSGDQLGTLASKAGVSWKKLAKMNKLKEPTVHVGQRIMMPSSFTPEPAAPVMRTPVAASPAATVPVRKPRTTKKAAPRSTAEPRAAKRVTAPKKRKPTNPSQPETL